MIENELNSFVSLIIIIFLKLQLKLFCYSGLICKDLIEEINVSMVIRKTAFAF